MLDCGAEDLSSSPSASTGSFFPLFLPDFHQKMTNFLLTWCSTPSPTFIFFSFLASVLTFSMVSAQIPTAFDLKIRRFSKQIDWIKGQSIKTPKKPPNSLEIAAGGNYQWGSNFFRAKTYKMKMKKGRVFWGYKPVYHPSMMGRWWRLQTRSPRRLVFQLQKLPSSTKRHGKLSKLRPRAPRPWEQEAESGLILRLFWGQETNDNGWQSWIEVWGMCWQQKKVEHCSPNVRWPCSQPI